MWTMPLSSSSRWRRRVVRAGGSGAQQVVDPLQLSVRQHQAVDLLVAAGARHHDPAHQHRVALPLLFCLQDTEQQQQTGETGERGETLLVRERRSCVRHLHKQRGGEGGEVRGDPGSGLLVDHVLGHLVLHRGESAPLLVEGISSKVKHQTRVVGFLPSACSGCR